MKKISSFDVDGLARQDDFYRKGFADRLARAIQQQPASECLVVSLTSEWGAGKSSVLHWMHSALAGGGLAGEMACITIMDFNPWGVSGERDMLFRLYENLVKKIDPSDELLTRWQRTKQLVGKHIGNAGKIAKAADQKLVGASIEGAGGLFESLCQVGIQEVRAGVEEKLLKSRWRLVVVLDDIDRLERHDLMILLRILKREAALPNITYILAMDEAQVAKTIGGDSPDAEDRGRKYLEKIIQAKLQLPAIPPHLMKRYAQQHILEATDSSFPIDLRRFEGVFDSLFLPRIVTPRTAKLIANTLRFTAGLLPGEVDTTDLALLECARHLFPELHERIKNGESHLKPSDSALFSRLMNRQDKEEIPPYRSWILKAWDDAKLGEPSSEEKLAIEAWFPQARSASIELSQEDAFWRSQRLCSPAYHWRYFTYAIVRGDIADSEVADLKFKCVANNVDAGVELKQALADERGRIVIEKLCRLHYTNDEIKSMIKFLGQHLGDQKESVAIATRICHSITAKSLEKLALDVVNLAPIEWAESFLNGVPKTLMNQESQHKGCPPNRARLTLSVRQLKRLRSQKESSVEMGVQDIWNIWHFGDVAELKKAIVSRLKRSPNYVYTLLASVCGRGMGVELPRVWRWNGEESLSFLQRLISIDLVKLALAKLSAPKVITSGDDDGQYCVPEELGMRFNSTLASLANQVIS